MKRLKDMAHKALHPGAAVIALLAVVSAAPWRAERINISLTSR